MDYFDLHCDTLYECYKKDASLKCNNLAVSVDKGREFGRWSQVFAIWIPDKLEEGITPYKLFSEIYDRALHEFWPLKSEILLCDNAGQMQNATSLGKSVAFLSVEGGSVLEGKLYKVKELYRKGVRMITLTWNSENDIAHGSESAGPVTPFGREVIAEMNRLNMMVDVSHLCTESCDEAIRLAKFPIATHSCSRSVFDHKRNLTDEQIVRLSQKGGIAGLCLYPAFLGQGDVFGRVYDHLVRFIELGGEDFPAIGSDFDGADMDANLNNICKIPDLYEYLLQKGMQENLLRKIFYLNASKFFMNVLTNCYK